MVTERSFVRPHRSSSRPRYRHVGHRVPRSARSYKEQSRNFPKLDRRINRELARTTDLLKRLQYLILRGLLSARHDIARNSGGSVDNSKMLRIYDDVLAAFRRVINSSLTMQQFRRSLPRNCQPRNTHVFRSFIASLTHVTREIDTSLATLFQAVCNKAAGAKSRCMQRFMTLITPEPEAAPA